MYKGQFIFTQIMNLVPCERFQTCVDRYQGDYRVRHFRCADYWFSREAAGFLLVFQVVRSFVIMSCINWLLPL
ncbi:MAG: DUF4372 domain-containing protein [Planctomycetaceae bacterium]|jgi:hypothetical protein|nr:DUF4372 domain-containing protein [Planctomycetaceae bacterium]